MVQATHVHVCIYTCIIFHRYFTLVQNFVFHLVEDSRDLKVLENNFRKYTGTRAKEYVNAP
jgi:hypothetical protein